MGVRDWVGSLGSVSDDAVSKLKQHFSTEQGGAQIRRLASTATLCSLQMGAKWIPGGVSLCNILTRFIVEDGEENLREVIMELEDRVGQLEKEVMYDGVSNRRLPEEAEQVQHCAVAFPSPSPIVEVFSLGEEIEGNLIEEGRKLKGRAGELERKCIGYRRPPQEAEMQHSALARLNAQVPSSSGTLATQREVGVWGLIHSINRKLWSLYYYLRTASSNIDSAVFAYVVLKLQHYLPGQQHQTTILRLVKTVISYYLEKIAMLIPGGIIFYNFICKEKIENHVEELAARVEILETARNGSKTLSEEPETKCSCDLKEESQEADCSLDLNVNQKPEITRCDEDLLGEGIHRAGGSRGWPWGEPDIMLKKKL